jgi:hypothetical protein
MGEVIYRIFVLALFYVVSGYVFYTFFPNALLIFSLLFLGVSVWVIWDAIEQTNAREMAKRDLQNKLDQIYAEGSRLDPADEARFAEAERLLPSYKLEYESALKARNKVLAYKLGVRYYLTGNLVERYYGTENEIAQRVKNEIDIYS